MKRLIVLLPFLTLAHFAIAQANCQADFSYSVNGQIVHFTDQSTYNNWVHWFWDFGDGTHSYFKNPVHMYSASGTYVVCLTISNNAGCQDTFCDTIAVGTSNVCIDSSIIDTTVACPMVYMPVCGCDSVTYNNACEAYNWHGVTTWTPGPCTGSGSCQADFTYQIFQSGVHFIDQSTASGYITSWHWDFGDGDSSHMKNPFHHYSSPGTYLVCLTIQTTDSCTSTFCDSVTVGQNQPCNAFFTSWSNGLNVHFNNMSSGYDLHYTWDFGDSTTSHVPNPWHTYSQAGTYVVCLSIDDSAGCQDTYCDTITVTTGQQQCIDSSLIDTTVSCPAVYMPVCGCDSVTYQNACIAMHYHGVTSWTPGPCNSNPAICHAKFSFQLTPGSFMVHFHDQSVATGNIVSWHWDFGDGDTSTQQNPAHTYSQPGMYHVCLTIITDDSCTSTWCHMVPVGGGTGCHADFHYFTFGNAVHFINKSTGIMPSFHWDFGDGSTSNMPNPWHTYSQSGSYLVCLTMTTIDSCVDTYCDTVHVGGGSCQADFTYSLNGMIATFTNQSTGNNLYYLWYFGDGNFSILENPVHLYQNPGIYVVCLAITDSATMCMDTYCDTLHVVSSGIDPLGASIGELVLYPNPVSDQLKIDFSVADPGQVAMQVTDISGRILATVYEGFLSKGPHHIEFDASKLEDGMYWMIIHSAEGNQARSFLIMR